MTLKVKLNCDNDAFDSSNQEVARILRKLADSVEEYGYGYHDFTLLDVNGNTVGQATFK